MIHINEEAPAWDAEIYNKGKKESLSSEDLKGAWYAIFWWPFDFTGICNSEVVGFQSVYSEFKELGIKLIGASCDSYFSHKQWFENTPYFNDESRPQYPIIADKNHKITTDFGFYNEESGSPHRGTVIVNPHGIVMSLSCNHSSVARDPKDVLATAAALSSGAGCSLPALQKYRVQW
jgi:alkyl hydroperoxide reductase subunit AhpC